MRQIRLCSLELHNFKGIADLSVQFHATGDTAISGRNATGKTALFDAFTWLLFGKDSSGRSDSNFNIKTLDAEGNPILKLDHSVKAVLMVDGKQKTLARTYAEKWVKPRGTTEETLGGHYSEFFVDDVNVGTKKAYDAEISAIIPEYIFRATTDPSYFAGLSADNQKAILLEMAGNVTDEEIVAGNPDFVALLAELSGRTLADYLKVIAAKKRGYKETLADIPGRIETANKLKPDAEDWDMLEAKMQSKQKEVAEIDAAIADKSKVAEAEVQRRQEVLAKIAAKQLEVANLSNAIRANVCAAHNDAAMAIKNTDFAITSKRLELKYKFAAGADADKQLAEIDQKLTAKRAEYSARFKTTLQIDETQFVCPTCGRPLEVDDIAAKSAEMTANFNAKKAEDLKAIQDAGKALAEERKEAVAKLDALAAEVKQLQSAIATLTQTREEQYKALPPEPNAAEAIANDSQVKAAEAEITSLKATLDEMGVTAPVDNAALLARKAAIQAEMQSLYGRLSNKAQIDKADAEIARLEELQSANAQALAECERSEYTAMAFQKAKDAEVLRRINDQFHIVSFSFVSQQLNGGEKLTCTCTVNGVPYADVNNAGRINAGLDIINALCRHYDVAAPVFVDNAESVNDILATASQKVLLRVGNETSLTIVD